jgi:hypothetical protein
VAVAAVLGVHYLGQRDGSGGTPSAGGLSASASAAPGPTSPPSSRPGARRPVPGGYHWVNDPEGFGFALPNDTGQGPWRRLEKNPGAIDYSPDPSYDPDHPIHVLRFGVTAGSSETPYQHALEMEQDHVSKNLAGYKRLALAHSTFKGMNAAFWSFTYQATVNGQPSTRYAREELVHDPVNGTEYDIFIGYPLSDQTTADQRFNTVLNSFTVENS